MTNATPDETLRRFLAADLYAHGAVALPAPPRVPSFGIARVLHTPPSMPAVDATVRPARAA